MAEGKTQGHARVLRAGARMTDDEITSALDELRERLRAGKVSSSGTAQTVIDETQQCLCKLGMKPAEVTRRTQSALRKGVYQDVQALLTATMKEV